MKNASVADFAGFQEKKLLKRTPLFFVARIGGFLVTTVGSLGFGIWAVVTNHDKLGAIVVCGLVLFGFAGFVVSNHVASYCSQCGNRLEQFWSAETRGRSRYTGPIFVCNSCKAFEARISQEFDN